MRRRAQWGLKRRGRHSSVKLALSTFIFWLVLGVVVMSLLGGGSDENLDARGEHVGKQYIGNIFPTINRGGWHEPRDIPVSQGESGVLKSLVGSMFPGVAALEDDLAEEDPGIIFVPEDATGENPGEKNPQEGQIVDGQNQAEPKPATANIDYTKPVVILYHTHATESYQPVTEGNFHSLEEYGTVRQVGIELAKELEAKGIQVIHDKTIHDSPSYNQSYSRSLETIQSLMANNQSTRIVVDVHRDAAAYAGNVPKTVTINKNKSAQFSLVVGTGNPNVEALRIFANHVNKKAEELYPDFGGKIIEKPYKFNQYVSDYHLLVEVGNNENTIEEAKLAGKYFADVLAEVIKDIQ